MKLIFSVCEVSTSISRLKSMRAIYIKYPFKLTQLRVKSSTAAVSQFWTHFLFVVLRTWKRTQILCTFKYTCLSYKARDNFNYKYCLEIASFILFPHKFMKKLKYNVGFCYNILWAKEFLFLLLTKWTKDGFNNQLWRHEHDGRIWQMRSRSHKETGKEIHQSRCTLQILNWGLQTRLSLCTGLSSSIFIMY